MIYSSCAWRVMFVFTCMTLCLYDFRWNWHIVLVFLHILTYCQNDFCFRMLKAFWLSVDKTYWCFLILSGYFRWLMVQKTYCFCLFLRSNETSYCFCYVYCDLFFTIYSAGFFWEHHGQFCQLCQAYAIHTAGVNQNLWLLNSFSWAELSMHAYAVPKLMGSLVQFIFLKHLFFPCV